MQQNWMSRFSDNIKDYQGYSIGKLFKMLNDPETISLAGGLPSPETFLKQELQQISQNRLQQEPDKIMQYTDISGEINLIEAVVQFLTGCCLNRYFEIINFGECIIYSELGFTAAQPMISAGW